MFKGTKSAIQEAVTLSKMLPKDEVSDPIVASLIKKLEESQGMSEAEFFAGLSQTEVDAFIDYINPKKADGTRTLTNEAYVRSREDLGSLKKIIMTCQTMRARNGDEKHLRTKETQQKLQQILKMEQVLFIKLEDLLNLKFSQRLLLVL